MFRDSVTSEKIAASQQNICNQWITQSFKKATE